MSAPVLAGDELVFAFEAHGRALSAIAAAWVGRVDVPDLLQESARVAWQRRHRFTPGGDLRAWLAQIIRYIGANWRRQQRPVAAETPDLVDPRPLPSVVTDDGFDAEHLGLSDDLANGLAGLSAAARECLLLRVVADHTFKEIADMLGIPENTASSHVRRAREALRAALTTADEPAGRVLSMPRKEMS